MQPAYARRIRPGIRDEEMLPASLSPELMQGLLRGKLGFNGLIVTDATPMGGFMLAMPRRKAVPAAIAAGADMFLFCKNVQEDYGFMCEGVRSGVISQERLDETVTRILALKASLRLYERPLPDPETVCGRVNLPEHRAWARDCAERAVTRVKEEAGVLPLRPEKYPRLLLCPLEYPETGAAEFTARVSVKERFRALLKKEGFAVDLFGEAEDAAGMSAPHYGVHRSL